jgi:hypothetical protein
MAVYLVHNYTWKRWVLRYDDETGAVVRVFTRHRGQLGSGGRATLRHRFRADPVRQAALEPLLEPSTP